MLRRLTIQDYGLIQSAEIDFSDGVTIFTGETGSGKTMVLGAIAFVLGERSGPDAVRRGQPRAAVTLEFDAGAALRERFERDGFPLDEDEDATLSRELTEGGKSSIRLNGRPATAAYVREIAAEVLDIVGQHEAQRLLSPAYHLHLLDRFAGEPALSARARVAGDYERRNELARALESADRDERRVAEQFAYAKYALDEIDAVAAEDDEDERLTQRRRILDNAEKIANGLRAAHEALAGDEEGAEDALGASTIALNAIADIGETFSSMAQAASALQSEVNELAVRISRELDELEFDASELESINARLDALDNLKRKYGGSLDAVRRSREEFALTVDRFTNRDEHRAQLERELVDASAVLEESARHLSELRRGAANAMRKSVANELKDLALPSARFDVRFEPFKEIAASGAEDVEFVFAANTGEPVRPLARVASGGELSRVLLALVVVLAGARGSTALVFDEIDAGIGGATANAVAVRLGRLAKDVQVVCVTHLAQIASWAETHYVLEKRERKTVTTIEVRRVEAAGERTAELARMLSGQSHDVALAHARTLLEETDTRRAALSS
ncbi:MAG TPA: DNA repair protein RecN [Candidatus Baltobacteraceae bacterium]|jgi:DNA repair protein RecN (Recombination protein N)|nr:DNA repair protein RecN [Candidatus Baltobacteraceae bacterium]